MPTRNVGLTPEQDAFIDKMLKAGEYSNASEAMRDYTEVEDEDLGAYLDELATWDRRPEP